MCDRASAAVAPAPVHRRPTTSAPGREVRPGPSATPRPQRAGRTRACGQLTLRSPVETVACRSRFPRKSVPRLPPRATTTHPAAAPRVAPSVRCARPRAERPPPRPASASSDRRRPRSSAARVASRQSCRSRRGPVEACIAPPAFSGGVWRGTVPDAPLNHEAEAETDDVAGLMATYRRLAEMDPHALRSLAGELQRISDESSASAGLLVDPAALARVGRDARRAAAAWAALATIETEARAGDAS